MPIIITELGNNKKMSFIPEDISRIKPDTTSDLEDIEEEDEGQGHHDHKNSAADAATSSGKLRIKAKLVKLDLPLGL